MNLHEKTFQTYKKFGSSQQLDYFCSVKDDRGGDIARRYGTIINLSSVVGIFGNAGQCNYAASKGAINAFTKSLSKELGARGVRVNGIAPGFILTEMTQELPEDLRAQYLKDIALHRLGTPEDVANLAVFLASDKASYITGEIINCSGNIKS